jgi:ClpP class serine protease
MIYLILPSLAAKYDAALAQAAQAQAAGQVVAETESPHSILADGTLHVPIHGLLVNERNRFLDFFGVAHTAIPDVSAVVHAAQSDPKVERIVLDVDSPGGAAGNPLIEAADAIHASTKPVVAQVGGMAASAAYWLASQADEIVLAGPASMVGSIGVVVDARLPGDDSVTITSTEAPNKRPDLATDQGRAVVRDVLDEMHAMFAAAVARGRGVSAETVNAKFGRGGMVLASTAVQVGMADRIIGATSVPESEHVTMAAMNLETLRQQYPQFVAALQAEGAEQERHRVAAHLDMAKQSGAHDKALEHIAAGLSVADPRVITAHHTAALGQLMQATARGEVAPHVAQKEVPVEKDEHDQALIQAFAGQGVDLTKGMNLTNG